MTWEREDWPLTSNATTSVKSRISIHGCETSRNFLGVSANHFKPTVRIWFVKLSIASKTATVEWRRLCRFRIRKESDLKFNRTINCVCWYLEFTLEKLPWVENHKTLIDHFVRSQIQKFLYHTRTGANSPATIHQVNSSLSFLFPSLIWEYHQRFNAQGFTSYNMYVVLFDFFYNSFN